MSARSPTLSIRLARLLIGVVEYLLRLFVLDRRLAPAKAVLKDLAYGNHPKQRLDVVVPEGPGPFPVLLYVHGGAWVTGDKSNFHWVTRALAAGGVLVVSANYRWAPEATFREQVQDVLAAAAWARAHAREHGGDPDRLFLAGDSAGAHLACWVHMAQGWPELLASTCPGAEPLSTSLRGSILLYGMYDLGATWKQGRSVQTPIRALLGAAPSERPDQAALASPTRLVSRTAAPVLVCAGERDALCGQSQKLLERLALEKAPHQALILERAEYPDAGHSFVNFGSRKASKTAVREALAFVAEHGAAR